MDLRSIDHVYKNQFGKHLDKLVSEETDFHFHWNFHWEFHWNFHWNFQVKLSLKLSGEGGDGWPLQKHLAWPPSQPWQDSMSEAFKKKWLQGPKQPAEAQDRDQDVCNIWSAQLSIFVFWPQSLYPELATCQVPHPTCLVSFMSVREPDWALKPPSWHKSLLTEMKIEDWMHCKT